MSINFNFFFVNHYPPKQYSLILNSDSHSIDKDAEHDKRIEEKVGAQFDGKLPNSAVFRQSTDQRIPGKCYVYRHSVFIIPALFPNKVGVFKYEKIFPLFLCLLSKRRHIDFLPSFQI